jgi:hypothetical protein
MICNCSDISSTNVPLRAVCEPRPALAPDSNPTSIWADSSLVLRNARSLRCGLSETFDRG